MQRGLTIVLIVFLLGVCLRPTEAEANYPHTYEYYLKQGKEYLTKNLYNDALRYFQIAQLVEPQAKEPSQYINLTKRLKEGKIEVVNGRATTKPKYTDHEIAAYITKQKVHRPPIKPIKKTLKSRNKYVEANRKKLTSKKYYRGAPVDPGLSREDVIENELAHLEFYEDKTSENKIISDSNEFSESQPMLDIQKDDDIRKWATVPKETLEYAKKNRIISQKTVDAIQSPNSIFMDDVLWSTQPKTLIRLDLNSNTIFEGNNIERFLILNPEFVKAKRINRNHIQFIAVKRGQSFVHVWDDRGRWTFNLDVIFPVRETVTVVEQLKEEYAKPFRLTYSSDWSSFYSGPSFTDFGRTNLSFIQKFTLGGESPYGDLHSFMVVNKFDESTEITGYGGSLQNGNIGNFKNFNIYGGDTSYFFSPLSLPGKYFRGVAFESRAFSDRISYAYLWGRDRASFAFLAPNVQERQESFIQGARVTLFPEEENNISFNFARGYGELRDDFLTDRVYSVQTNNRLNNYFLSTETAYNEEYYARTALLRYEKPEFNAYVSFRDIDENYTNISNYPGGRGEVGGILGFEKKLGDLNVRANMDIYRDLFLENVDDPKKLNYDLNTFFDYALSPKDRLVSSVFYVHTPGELSPRRNIRYNSTYSKRFKMGESREASATLGAGYQRSRFKSSISSEFDRYSVNTGIQFPLIRSLSYYANYEYSWVNERIEKDILQPSVLNTGLNLSRRLTDNWSSTATLSYRNEENTEGINSFLAGEDSVTASVGASYRPNQDFEFFVDGRMRNVWAEQNDNTAFNEFDIRWGVRMAWDSPFSWNPNGIIEGVVYKDLNGNQRQDNNEIGIENVIVQVGNKEAFTDKEGRYQIKIHAKKVQVNVDINSIPNGFIFSTPPIEEVKIIPHKRQVVNFGLSTQSGIYGIAFYDKNNNKKPDPDDQFIARMKITLDNEESILTDFEGTYFFRNVTPGKHTLTIDVNSLPIEYLPKIKLKKTIDLTEGTTYIFHVPLKKK